MTAVALRRMLLRGALVAVAAVVVGYVAWRHLPHAVVDAFSIVIWRWVALAILWNLLSVVARAVAWRTVIEQASPPPRPAYHDVFAAFCVGLFANAVLPGRIGELARVAVLRRRYDGRSGSGATLVGTVFAHRLFDLPPVIALIVYVLLAAKIPAWADLSLELFVVVGLVALLVAMMLARRHEAESVAGLGQARRLLRMARFGLGVLHQPLAASGAVVGQFVGWGFQLVAVYTAMRAFDIHSPLAAAALVLLLMNVATVFPLWPGNIGIVQAAIAFPLLTYGVGKEDGVVFGFGLQAIEASVGIGLGFLFLAREGFSYGSLKRMPQIDEAEESG